MTTSRAILATQHPSPPTANGSQCRLFAFASSSLAFPQLSLRFSPAFPGFFPSFKSNKQRHRQEGKRKHGKCQHTLKRLANGDNVKHERSEWSVQSGESWGKARGKQGAFVVGSPPATSHHSPSNSGGSPARLKDAGQVGGHKMVGSAAGFR